MTEIERAKNPPAQNDISQNDAEIASLSKASEPFTGYNAFLSDIKERIQGARTRAAFAVNAELVLLYWTIGREISQRMQEHSWGSKVVDQLAGDLRRAFPEMKGLSLRNLRYMRSFAEAWPDASILQAALAKLTWYHNIALLEKLASSDIRLWYARHAVEHGWSRNVLVHQIESNLYARLGKATTNFERTLPAPQSDLANQILKDPYNFEFLELHRDAEERDLERGLLNQIRKFLLELGAGFAFMGSQYHLEFDGEDYYLDLLFYHVKLRCYVVIELKTGKFLPEYAGKMNFYLNVVDDVLRHPEDAPSIGLILCKQKKALSVEYALRGSSTPIGVSEYQTGTYQTGEYQITANLPADLQSSLPTAEQLVAELSGNDETNPSSEETDPG